MLFVEDSLDGFRRAWPEQAGEEVLGERLERLLSSGAPPAPERMARELERLMRQRETVLFLDGAHVTARGAEITAGAIVDTIAPLLKMPTTPSLPRGATPTGG